MINIIPIKCYIISQSNRAILVIYLCNNNYNKVLLSFTKNKKIEKKDSQMNIVHRAVNYIVNVFNP